MTKHSAIRPTPSLLERAAELYDFRSGLRVPAPVFAPEPPPEVAQAPEPAVTREPAPATPPGPRLVHAQVQRRPVATIDRTRLAEGGFILPDAPATGLAEEYRIIKRQLLTTMGSEAIAEDRKRTMLVSSGNPDEGKTFSAINLALSLAGEHGIEVLLIDGDFNKPEIPDLLGIEAPAGFVDAIADPTIDPESLVVPTDIVGLSVLSAGRQAHDVTEMLASERTRAVLAALHAARPDRIILFDSPPILAASPASVLASLVGQVLLIVRADSTSESNLRESVSLLSGCAQISLVLNAAGFAGGGPRFGSYYGYGV